MSSEALAEELVTQLSVCVLKSVFFFFCRRDPRILRQCRSFKDYLRKRVDFWDIKQ